MSDIVKRDVDTRMVKNGPKATTALTLDFSKCDREDLIALATPTVVIDRQADYRNSSIPSEETLDVKEYLGRPRAAGGFKPTPENMAARIGKMDKADYTATLVNMGLDEKTVSKLVKAKFPE